jgi:hypothetical protein
MLITLNKNDNNSNQIKKQEKTKKVLNYINSIYK